MTIPVFINNRDRVTPMAQMVDWLENAGVTEIYLIDNDSTYEPLLDYYRRSPHKVVLLDRNFGKNALWIAPGVFDLTRGRAFAYSDSDVVPDPACPDDVLDLFRELLDRYSGINKAGFSIRYDDIPDHYAHKARAVALERYQQAWPLGRNVYYGSIDTSFAVYRPNAEAKPHEAARTGYPYIARHTSYYLDFANLSEEDAYYQRRSQEVRESGEFTLWASPELQGADDIPALPGLITKVRWRLRGRRSVRR